jgi:predicted nucleic acid-binding protein
MSYFLDSNVLIDWVLISEKIKEDDNLSDDHTLRKRIKEMSYAYTLVNLFFNSMDKKEVLTSYFAIAETYKRIYDEILYEKLYEKAVPYTMWEKLKKYENLNEEKITIFRDNVFNYIRKFKKNFTVVNDVVDKQYFSTFFHKSDIGIYDSFLLSTALKNNADYFITRDSGVIHLRKKTAINQNIPIFLKKPDEILRAYNNK